MNSAETEAVASRLLNLPVKVTANLQQGKNSKVYVVMDSSGEQYVVKCYFTHGSDSRDRMNVEFSSFNYLWKNRIHCIPRPLIADSQHHCAIYNYIKGQKLETHHINRSDVDHFVAFLSCLRSLSRKDESRELPTASEACFSLNDIFMNLNSRLARLLKSKNSSPGYQMLNTFLSVDFIPFLKLIHKWCRREAERNNIPFTNPLENKERTLSPSDIGFHNALKKEDDSICFLDFEYFGWDDPAKTISDFLLHPAMDLSHDLKNRFLRSMLNSFSDIKGLLNRVKIVYPLFGMKWCLILLNEFVPEFISRRVFSGGHIDHHVKQTEQLFKARQMLNKIRSEYECFPYGC